MRVNEPVTQREFDYPADEMLVSVTNLKGEIEYCNPAFVRTSGFTAEELVGQPHNLIRHPDMPPEAFKDLWRTIGHGKPWSAIVKNRRKDGDHYWVVANVTPILKDGRVSGYMSVRVKPTRAQIDATSALYARMRSERASGRSTISLRDGYLRRRGLLAYVDALRRISLTQRMAAALLATGAATVLPLAFGLGGGLGAAACAVSGGVVGAGMLAWLHRTITFPIEASIAFANRMAAGDLTQRAECAREDQIGALKRALTQLNVNLRAVVSDVRTEVENMRGATGQIAEGNHDLSARTESQAANLQETAASMDQITTTVRQTADTAHEMSAVSAQANQVASKGGTAVAEVEATMRAINGSSKKVSEIIQIIEGIAFQTNILALNAAVEAARAGEQGRGFAVVASEVRALAQRSSGAAKEIRELISASVNQIAAGAQQVEGAGATMHQVVEAVGRVGVLIEKISAATKEQSLGISQVNQAVNSLDGATQQNAALVEEAAAAASSLEQQALVLTRAVQIFRL